MKIARARIPAIGAKSRKAAMPVAVSTVVHGEIHAAKQNRKKRTTPARLKQRAPIVPWRPVSATGVNTTTHATQWEVDLDAPLVSIVIRTIVVGGPSRNLSRYLPLRYRLSWPR